MAKVKVLVRYPMAFAGVLEAGTEVEIEEAEAMGLVAEGFAELVVDKLVAELKRGPGRPKKASE